MIYETVVTTLSREGAVHVAPMGVRYEDASVLLMPFLPSTTYDNVIETGCAVVNAVTDTRVFAGCVTGRRRTWPVLPASEIAGVRLEGALGHVELALAEQGGDAERPVLRMRRVHEAIHAPF